MSDHVDVSEEMFKLLESYAGTETDDDEVVQLAGESLENYHFTGLFYIDVPPLHESTLTSWDFIDTWLDELGGFISEDILPENLDLVAENNTSPIEIFGSLERFKKVALEKLGERITEEKSSVACVEVSNNDQTLYLVYDDVDDWSFGFNDRIKVFRGDEFTEENGYFDL